jgi:hypothetical protein
VAGSPVFPATGNDRAPRPLPTSRCDSRAWRRAAYASSVYILRSSEMNQVHVDAAREEILAVLQKYEGFAVVTACLSVAAYTVREMLKLGVASPRFAVLAFTCALRLAFEKTSSTLEKELGELH